MDTRATRATNASASISDRYYQRYMSTHTGLGGGIAARLTYRRDLRPWLPRDAAGRRVLDIGCGQGDLLGLLSADAFDAHGIDASAEQVQVAHDAGLDQIVLGDFLDHPTSAPGGWDAVIATDVLEHLGKEQVARTFDHALAGAAGRRRTSGPSAQRGQPHRRSVSGLYKFALAAETRQLCGRIVTHNLLLVARRGMTASP